MLDVVNIHKAFFPGTINEKVALAGVDLHLDEGDFCTVIGSNGAGKSTLLNTISGRYRPDGGAVKIDGQRVDRLPDYKVARHVARVFQDPMAGTAAHMTIEENLALALGRGTTRGLGPGITQAKRSFFRERLAVLEQGLEDRLTTKVGLLSGGQRQALSLVMATFSNPKMLLLDEHTAALDPQRAELITRLTRELVAEKGLTTLMVTHNMGQALRLGNKLIMMHEGRIILELGGEDKAAASVEDLMAEFDKIKGVQLSDRTLLA
ncbi:MAG: ABC transporter ATP-binding protein [Propionibacteriaceae bacterium]|uniref:Adenosinetriphosphatase n=1 Tax=Propionibacterium ruminifibrarum TaxID=1962131 RepID=A0A375HZ34_9ACTN|nr:ABC transporter ATP-binding protein [Propionibacterium ruminifibrarum]MBE6478569.1 ABC transporter ATP-binding protein [Propionibacteriaceae bacterium]SPF66998.1 adenosinetriphosphatase [Propionibacterium ruminifibrarum]